MTDYTKFDAALMALLAGGVRSFAALAAQLNSQAKSFCTTDRAEPFRVVDRRLQALRKKKLVAYSSKAGWSLIKA